MPELPEVETVVRILNTFVPNKTIKDIIVYRPKSVLTDINLFKSSLIGKTFKPCTRIGKHIIFHLSDDKVIVSHLRMEGKYFESREEYPKDKHDILTYIFTDGTSLRFNDVRKFGVVILKDEKDYLITPPISEVGKEPWDLSKEELFEGLQSKKGPIKEALLDQSLIAGLGNIYDDEVLFATKINPRTPANKITLEECESIIKESRRILENAIENGGSTIRSYHPKEGMDGRMQNELLAYGHGNEKCPRCGSIMRKIFIGGRGTTYCPSCQPSKDRPYIVGVTGKIASGKSEVARYLKTKGYKCFDADKIVHELYKKDEIKAKIGQMFGKEALIDGEIDKKALLEIISKNPLFKEKLENFIHPLVYSHINEGIANCQEKKVVLDIPLLLNGPLENECDLIIYIDADIKTREERIAKRGKDMKKALLLNASWPSARAKNVSGIKLNGNGSIEELHTQLDKYNF